MCLAQVVLCLVLDMRCPVFGVRYEVSCVGCPVSRVWYKVSGIGYGVSSVDVRAEVPGVPDLRSRSW